MYYEESENLIHNQQEDKSKVRIFDRVIAHTYAPNFGGQTETSLLKHKTGLNSADLKRLLDYFEKELIVAAYSEVECECGNQYEKSDESCAECGLSSEESKPTGKIFYRILKQPQLPAFNPDAQPVSPDVFISYRLKDTQKLAADIYYSLLAEGHSVFLDKGEIPVGTDAEKVFLKAASKANYFIALVSQNYFDSEFCKKEFAHSMRKGNRLIRVNVPPIADIPNDMPWVNSPNWLSQEGQADGLTPELEIALTNAVRIPSTANVDNLRKKACQFLLDQLSTQEILAVWNRLSWMTESFGNPPISKQEKINLILQEAISEKLNELCNSLAPE